MNSGSKANVIGRLRSALEERDPAKLRRVCIELGPDAPEYLEFFGDCIAGDHMALLREMGVESAIIAICDGWQQLRSDA